jgi:biotin operon repressor
MSGTSTRILVTLADAPMSDEALMHELEISRRSLGQALGHLQRAGHVEQDDRGLWFLLKPDAQPLPVVDAEPPVPALPRRPESDATGYLVEQPATPRPTPAIGIGDQVLQVLIAAGRVTQDDIRLASKLIGAR